MQQEQQAKRAPKWLVADPEFLVEALDSGSPVTAPVVCLPMRTAHAPRKRTMFHNAQPDDDVPCTLT